MPKYNVCEFEEENAAKAEERAFPFASLRLCEDCTSKIEDTPDLKKMIALPIWPS